MFWLLLVMMVVSFILSVRCKRFADETLVSLDSIANRARERKKNVQDLRQRYQQNQDKPQPDREVSGQLLKQIQLGSSELGALREEIQRKLARYNRCRTIEQVSMILAIFGFLGAVNLL
jgi:hypothetical protein